MYSPHELRSCRREGMRIVSHYVWVWWCGVGCVVKWCGVCGVWCGVCCGMMGEMLCGVGIEVVVCWCRALLCCVVMLREYNIIYLSQIAMYWSITGTEKSVRRLFHPPHKLQCGREEGSGWAYSGIGTECPSGGRLSGQCYLSHPKSRLASVHIIRDVVCARKGSWYVNSLFFF